MKIDFRNYLDRDVNDGDEKDETGVEIEIEVEKRLCIKSFERRLVSILHPH